MKNIVTVLKYKKYFGKGKKMGWKARPEEPPSCFLTRAQILFTFQDSYLIIM